VRGPLDERDLRPHGPRVGARVRETTTVAPGGDA
jgi:hypothetical protein